MEKLFKLKEHGTDVKTEVIAGVTTFMTMAYILAVNPNMLSATGMDAGAVFTATALSSAIASFIMAFAANLPFVLSAGMGLNAYFAYTVCIGMGLSWEIALTAVFVEGIVFIILSLTNVREAIFNAIPSTLKIAVSVGIGLFICFIGLQNAHLIVLNESTKVAVFSLSGSLKGGSFSSEGITVLLAFIGILITAILLIKQVKGNILIGILITWILGILCQVAGIYVPNPEAGFYDLYPTAIFSMPASVAPTFMKLDFGYIAQNFLNFIVIMFAFLTEGQLKEEIGVYQHLLSKQAKQYEMRKADIELLNIKCHDLKHQIHALAAEHKSIDERELKQISEVISVYDAGLTTGSEALNIVLMEKQARCKKEGIRLSVIADGAALSFLKDNEIYSLFGNAVDNAIEASIQVEEEKRFISIVVERKKAFVSIVIQNYCLPDSTETFSRNRLPKTTKKDKENHGFGLKSIEYLVQSYDGDLQMKRTEEGIFSLDILLPIPAVPPQG